MRQRQPLDERSLLSIVGDQRAISIKQSSKQMTLNSKYQTQIIKRQGASMPVERADDDEVCYFCQRYLDDHAMDFNVDLVADYDQAKELW